MKDESEHHIHTNLDTVIINTDEDIVLLLWRGNLDIYGRLYNIYSVKVEMSNTAGRQIQQQKDSVEA